MLAASAAALTLVSAGWGSASAFRPQTAAASGTRDLWVLGDGELLRSTAGGRHFTPVSAPPLPAQGVVPTLVFANARDGYAYMQTGGPLYVTHDGGQTWIRAGLRGDVVALAVGGGEVYVVAGHALERSPVRRDAWRTLPLRISRLRVFLAARGRGVWILGAPRRLPDSDTIYVSADRGRSFASGRGPCVSELGGRLVPAAADVVWAVCQSGMMAALRLSKNGGRSFALARSFHDPGGLREPPMTNGAQVAAASKRDAIVYTGAQGPLLSTTDAGRRWTRLAQTARFKLVFWLSFSSSRVGAVLAQTASGPAKLWRTTNAGASWRVVPLP